MNSKKLIIEAIKDQRAIFGDDLFESVVKRGNSQTVYKEPEKVKFVVAEKTEYNNNDNLFAEDFLKSDSLEELYSIINQCQKCSLGKSRIKFVFGVGNPNADVMLIGEAPGAEEDKQGEPFVGRAGKLLTDILKAINFRREEVYIANILKCRPPNNRDPQPNEMETCKPYVLKQIDLIKPKLILCLGRVAANSMLNKNLALGKMRQNIYELNDIKVMATYHPAALLRNPNWKRGCWEDVKKFRQLYEELVGSK
ncbi:uracil-DNA glycosylase family protein [Bacteroidota bacterium]